MAEPDVFGLGLGSSLLLPRHTNGAPPDSHDGHRGPTIRTGGEVLLPRQAKDTLRRLAEESHLPPKERLALLCTLLGLYEDCTADDVVHRLRSHRLLRRLPPKAAVPGSACPSGSDLDEDSEVMTAYSLGFVEGGLDDWMVVMLATANMPMLPTDVDLPPTLDSPSQVLSEDLVRELYCSLPPRCRCVEEWLLAHSTLLHGESFSMLYDHILDCPDIILVVRTTKGDVFGAFVPSDIRPKGSRYFGSRETFVFTYFASTYTAYPWSHKNDFFVFSMDTKLGIGGGTHFAIFLEDSLAQGTTGSCETFQCPPLVSNCDELTADFTIHSLEVWCVGPVHPADLKEKLVVHTDSDLTQQMDVNMYFSPMPLGAPRNRPPEPPPKPAEPNSRASSKGVTRVASSTDDLASSSFRPRRAMATAKALFVPSPDPSLDAPGLQRWLRGTNSCTVPNSQRRNSRTFFTGTSLQSITSGRSHASSLREAYAERPPAPLRPLKFVLGVAPTASGCRAAGLLAAVARRDDWVHLYTVGANPTPLQRISTVFVCMDEFHVSWDYNDQPDATPKTGLLEYTAKHRIDIVVVGRNPEGKTKPSLSDELLAGVTGGPAALWVVTRPMNLFPPVYMLCADDSPQAERAVQLLQYLVIPGCMIWVFGWYKAKANTAWQTSWMDDPDDLQVSGRNEQRRRHHSSYSTSSAQRRSRCNSSASAIRPAMPPDGQAPGRDTEESQAIQRVRITRDVLLQALPGIRVATCTMGANAVGPAVLEFAASKRIQTIVCPNQPQSSFRRLLAGPSLSSHLAAHAKGHAVLFVN
eukprot:EG_transcript_2917